MRIPSGVTDQYVYFVALDATDLKSRETGLSSFTVYRSRNGGASAAFTTPTINETDNTNMPGVYELLLDEDMTIDAGDDEQEMLFHITCSGMAPVTRAITLFRPKITAGVTLVVESDGMAHADVKEAIGTAWGSGAITSGSVSTAAAMKIVDADPRLILSSTCETSSGTGLTTTGSVTDTRAGDEVILLITDQSTGNKYTRGAVVVDDHGFTMDSSLGFTVEENVDPLRVYLVPQQLKALPNAVAGAAGGLFIAGTNAATSIATALTANVTGNLSGTVGGIAGTITSLDTLASTILSKLLKYVQLLFRSDAAIATDNAAELTEINADGGSGAGDCDNTTDSLERTGERLAIAILSDGMKLSATQDNVEDETDTETYLAVAGVKVVTDRLSRASKTIVEGTVDVSATTTSIPIKTISPSAVVTDQFKGLILKFASDTATANLRGQGTDITGNSTTAITVTALTTAPAEDDSWVIQ